MKKILICFLFLYTSISFGQVTTTLSSPNNYFTYTPVNVGGTVSTDQIILSGASLRTKSNKEDGTRRAYQRWMRYWVDSTDLVQDSGFADSSTWFKSSAVIFNGGVLSFTDASVASIQDTLLVGTTEGMPCRITFTVSNTTGLRISFQERNLYSPVSPVIISGATTYTNGTHQIDYVARGRNGFYMEFSTAGSTGDVDNVSIISMADSVSGYQKILSSVVEDIPYYFSQSGKYITATDTIYASAEVDTIYSLINSPTAYDIYATFSGINVIWEDNSLVEDGYEVYRGIADGQDWILQTTTAPNVESYFDNETDSLVGGTQYRYRVRATGTYSNSDYSATMTEIALEPETDTDPPSAPTNVDAINLALLNPPVPPDTIPSMTNFADVINADSLGYYQGYTVLSNLDSCWVFASTNDSLKKGALGTYNLTGFKGYAGDTIYTAITASASYSVTITNTITAGGIQRIFSVTRSASPEWDGNIWYVDRDATGANNGRTWIDAWTSIDSGGWTGVSTGINWHAVQAGDTIYISGGSDSTVYLPPTNYGSGVYRDYTTPSDILTFNEPVIVTPAWQIGHNGTVYFSSRNNNNQVIFRVQYISNVTFDGGINKRFHLIDERDESEIPLLKWSGLIQIGNGDHGDLDSLITLKNWNIYSRNLTDIIGVQGAKNKIIDCIIDQESNHYASTSDPIGVNIGRGGHTIDGNTIISRNYYESTGGTANASVTVGSNFLRDTRLSMTTNYYSDSYATVGYTENDTAYNMIVTSNDNNTFYGDWDVFVAGARVSTTNYPTQQGLAWGTDDPHKDMIQFSDYGFGELLGGVYATERLPTVVSNNLIVNTSAVGTGWNALLYSSNPRCHSSFYVYNNIFASAGGGSTNTPIVVYQPDTEYEWNFSQYILNNTIVLNSASGSNNLLDLTGNGNEGAGGVDTTVVKNNLLIADIDFDIWLNLRIMFYPYYRDFDYNYYADPDDILLTDAFYMGEGFGGATLDRWVNGYESYPPYDANSYWEDSDNTTFIEKYGTDINDYVTTTGKGLGIDLSATYPFLATDITGNDRATVWDIGAIEFPEGGMPEEMWQRIKPFLRNDETDFWKGQR